MKYRKIPVIVEVIKWTGDNKSEVQNFCGYPYTLTPENDAGHLFIKILDGIIGVCVGDFIIKGVNGEFCPCKSDIFEKTYEPAE